MQPVLVQRKKARGKGGELGALGSGPRPGEAPHLPPTVSAVATSQAPPSSPEAETLTLGWLYNLSPVNPREAEGYSVPHSFPFVCRWTSRLLPCPGYCKQCRDEHWGTRVSFSSDFLGVYALQWDCWVVWQFYFQFLRNCSP